ncbi:MAG: Pr6Pr family membrane protein [Devosia sp.]
MSLRKWFVVLAMLAGVVGLALDFSVIAGTMVASPDNPVPRSLLDMLVYYWTFLTNLSNLALLLIYVSSLVDWPWLGWFRRPVTRAGMAGIIVLVMGFYHVMLAPNLPDVPLAIDISNVLLHTVTPLLYLGWWALWSPHGSLRVRDVPWMLVPGLSYVIWVLMRGLFAAEYPYTILDPTFAIPGHGAQGYLGVAIGVPILLAAVALFDLLLVVIDGLIARRLAASGGSA